MHRAAFAAAGLPGEYEALRVTPDQLPAMIADLRQPEVLGANLSLPHKEAALPLLDELSAAAQAIGAVNTIINRAGRLVGTNTDAPGFLAALADAAMSISTGQVVVILGAGGAARAAVYAASTQQAEVYVVNRTPERAQALAAEFGAKSARLSGAGLTEIPWENVALIVNSSSAGLSAPDQSPLPDFDFGQCPQAAVYDMVYKPSETRLMREARAAGLRAENGLGMLAHQARLAFEEWTGAEVPVSVFLGALTGRGA